VLATSHSTQKLDTQSYKNLAQPSKNNPPTYFGSVKKNLFEDTVMSYMHPKQDNTDEHSQMKMDNMPEMNHTMENN